MASGVRHSGTAFVRRHSPVFAWTAGWIGEHGLCRGRVQEVFLRAWLPWCQLRCPQGQLGPGCACTIPGPGDRERCGCHGRAMDPDALLAAASLADGDRYDQITRIEDASWYAPLSGAARAQRGQRVAACLADAEGSQQDGAGSRLHRRKTRIRTAMTRLRVDVTEDEKPMNEMECAVLQGMPRPNSRSA